MLNLLYQDDNDKGQNDYQQHLRDSEIHDALTVLGRDFAPVVPQRSSVVSLP